MKLQLKNIECETQMVSINNECTAHHVLIIGGLQISSHIHLEFIKLDTIINNLPDFQKYVNSARAKIILAAARFKEKREA